MRKLNLTPADQIIKGLKTSKYSVTITKPGIIYFMKKQILEQKLKGKFIRFYLDESKKILGWKFLNEKSLGELKGYKMLHVFYTNGTPRLQVGIQKILEHMKLKGKVGQKIPVNEYKENGIEFQYINLHHLKEPEKQEQEFEKVIFNVENKHYEE